MRLNRIVIGTLALAVLVTACGRLQLGDQNKRREMDAALRQTLESSSRPSFVTRDQEGARLWKQTQQFYQRRTFEPAWTRDAAPRTKMEDFIEALRAAGDEGLDPELYGVSMLESKWQEGSKGFLTKKGFDPREAAVLDVWLTYLYMKFASDLADGLSDLAQADPSWQIKPEKIDPLLHLERALQKGDVTGSLRELTPDDPEYRALRKTLTDHRALAANGGWPKVPANIRIKPGQRSPHVRAIAARLAASGDFTGTVPAEGQPAAYDASLQEAVKRFQRRHGLEDNGIVTPAVAAAMNVPIEQRIDQIVLNLERWRWLPRNPGRRHMLVNVPEQRLDVWEDGRVVLSMRVIVGKRDWPTPIFNDEMTHIVFSPYWNVPPNIAADETLPALMKDPGFLERNNMEVVDSKGRRIDASAINWMDPASFRFRQRPGDDNALGLVKFMFPNQFNVYLHDTPTDSLFGRAARLFSHGCVRVEKPEDLAQYVLRDQPEWTLDRIRAAMNAGQERHVKLREPIPVYIGYWTARVSPDGIVQFRDDVYGLDANQKSLLAERLRRQEASTNAAAAAAQPQTPKDQGPKDQRPND